MTITLLARQSLLTQQGGDTVQILQTALALENLGHVVHIIGPKDDLPSSTDVLHFFNIGRPADALVHFANFQGTKVVSTVYVDYSFADRERWPWLFRLLGSHGIEYFKTLARAKSGSDLWPPARYLWKGQKRSMRQLLKEASIIITSSQSELTRLQPICKTFAGKELRDKHRLIPLGVNEPFLTRPSSYSGARHGLLMVGRLEHIKGQLPFIALAVKMNWPLTVVGEASANQGQYAAKCLSYANDHIVFEGPQEASRIIELMDRHSAVIIPSKFETYSLVGWEAAARGVAVIANRVPDMIETLGPVANLLDFNDEDALIAAVEDALLLGSEGQKKSQVQWEHYTWDAIGAAIEKTYR